MSVGRAPSAQFSLFASNPIDPIGFDFDLIQINSLIEPFLLIYWIIAWRVTLSILILKVFKPIAQ